jgi:hypothetical protein
LNAAQKPARILPTDPDDPGVKTMPAHIRRVSSLVLVAAIALLNGCSAYVLQGKVVRGQASAIELVYAGDERLAGPAAGGVEVRVTRDPTTMNRKLVGHTRSDAGGEFVIIMEDFGTGWMQEQWLVQAVAPGYQNAELMMELPSKNSKWRVLITLAAGVSEPIRDNDIMEDLEQFK